MIRCVENTTLALKSATPAEMRRFYQWQLDHYGQTLEEAEFMWDPDSGRWVEYQGAAT